jgi:hypothetical protein
MALIKNFVRRDIGRGAVHPTSVDCYFHAFEVSGATILQLDTQGSRDRKQPGKQSQTLQLNRDSARRLRDIIARSFPEP